jgi:hypothetical protein
VEEAAAPFACAGGAAGRMAAWVGVNNILNMKVFLLAAAGSGNLANEHSLDLLIS